MSDPEQSSTGRRRTVLQVLPSLETGGVERGTVDIAAALVTAGFRAIVASSGGAMVREILRAGAEHVALPVHSKNPIVMWRNVGRLVRLIETEAIDLVHARSRAPAWSARAAASRTGKPFVTTFHGTYNAKSSLKRAYNAIMAKGDRVIAISKFIAQHVQTDYGVDPARIRVIHRGVDFDVFSPDRVSSERLIQLARQWRIPDDARVVMLPGRLTRWKGHTVLIEAMRRLADHRDWVVRCILVGSDQGRTGYRAELEGLIASLGLLDRVQIVDECRDMAAAYTLADVVVSASTDPEAFGRVAVEAQAMGCPVVATDHGGARETVVPASTGWLVPPGDAGMLAAAIDAALALDDDARQRLRARAIAHVRANFSKAQMGEATLAVYRELLGD
ncbi:MAG: glycosyltransferase family 4 protein [Alphaproteobacteria bacterium]